MELLIGYKEGSQTHQNITSEWLLKAIEMKSFKSYFNKNRKSQHFDTQKFKKCKDNRPMKLIMKTEAMNL